MKRNILNKKIGFFLYIFILSFSNFSFAANDEIKLKRSCLKDYPQAVGQMDQSLLRIYEQICNKKNMDKKNDLLAQAAMRFYELEQNINALLLVNQLKNQNVQGSLLTDVAFLSGVAIANDSLKEMRSEQMRYLNNDVTYPPAKQLIEQIRLSAPAPQTSELKGVTDASLKAARRKATPHIASPKRTPPKVSTPKTNNSSKTRSAAVATTQPAATTTKSNVSPFDALK